MATQVPLAPMGSFGEFFRGESRGRPLGAELQSMRLQGQEVIRTQRVRWQYNRSIYRGEQYIRPAATTLRTLAPAYRLPSGKRRDSVNRARRFVDGRAASMTMAMPNFGVKPEANTRAAYDAAEIATNITQFYWTKLDLASKFRHMIRMGDTDGIAFLSVYYDHTDGESISLPFTKDGQPISSPDLLIALEAEGMVDWSDEHTGDVCVRNVPIGRMSIDPLARDNFAEARWVVESRIRPRADIEREAGKSLENLMRDSGAALGERYGAGKNILPSPSAQVSVDEFDEGESTLNARDYLLVHEAYIKPTGKYGDWPQGCHAVWLDLAPGDPISVKPWKRALPYICYVPQPDHGHFLKAKAVMDDLAPLQIALNRAVSQYHEILDLHARLPVMAQRGALVSKFLYNDKRIVEYNPGFQQPNWMQPPPEPTRLLENIQFLLEQMAEIAVQNDVSRGTPPGHGIEAGVGLNLLAQQNEQQLEGLASAARRAMEDTCTMILSVIRDFFTVQRTITIPGVNGVEEIKNFVGSMLRGADRVFITGSLLPRNQAAQQQTLITLATGGLIDIRPYIPQLTEGRVEEVMTDMERHEREQRRENGDMDLLAQTPDIDRLWAAFQELRGEHAALMDEYRMAQANFEAVPAMPQDPTAMAVPGMPDSFPVAELPPPPAPPVLADIGITVPPVEEWNDDALHSQELDRARCADGYNARHPLVKQAYHEHNEMHIRRMSERLDSLAVQPGGPQPPPDAPQEPGTAMPGESAGGQPPSANAPATPSPELTPPAMGLPSEPQQPVNVNFDQGAFQVSNAPPEEIQGMMEQLTLAVEGLRNIEIPAPIVNMPAPVVNVPAPVINVDPNVIVQPADVTVQAAEPPVVVENHPKRISLGNIERDRNGRITGAELIAEDE